MKEWVCEWTNDWLNEWTLSDESNSFENLIHKDSRTSADIYVLFMWMKMCGSACEFVSMRVKGSQYEEYQILR